MRQWADDLPDMGRVRCEWPKHCPRCLADQFDIISITQQWPGYHRYDIQCAACGRPAQPRVIRADRKPEPIHTT